MTDTSPDQAKNERPISLDALKGAFAKMLGGAEEPSHAADSTEAAEESYDLDSGTENPGCSAEEETTTAEETFDAEVTPIAILEAMLFVGTADNEPLPAKRVASLMRGVTPSEIGSLVEELNTQYREEDAPYEVVSDANGYRMALCAEFDRTRQKFYGRVRQAKLSPSAVEVLSLVAYNQPTTKEEVSKTRGAKSGPLLTQLVRRQLLQIDRDGENKRLVHYSTTDRFLRLFGLQRIEDLPRSEDLLEE